MAIAVKTGDIVSFQLVINGINGDERVQVKVASASINYQAARMIDPQLAVKHVALYPHFQDKVQGNDDPAAYDYMLVQGLDQLEVIGIPWIQESTFKLINTREALCTITNFREEFRAPFETFLSNLGATYTLTVKDK